MKIKLKKATILPNKYLHVSKSGAAVLVFCGYSGNRCILPFRKRNIIYFNVNQTLVGRQEANAL